MLSKSFETLQLCQLQMIISHSFLIKLGQFVSFLKSQIPTILWNKFHTQIHYGVKDMGEKLSIYDFWTYNNHVVFKQLWPRLSPTTILLIQLYFICLTLGVATCPNKFRICWGNWSLCSNVTILFFFFGETNVTILILSLLLHKNSLTLVYLFFFFGLI